jgi:uncharacterized repeat protein (TIGR01451 family)
MKTVFRNSLSRNMFFVIFSAALFFSAVRPAVALLDAEFQMQLGNPSAATADPNNHDHYLIQRAVYALDYSDNLGEPNWVSWDLTVADVGGSGRSDFQADTSLPPGFYQVPASAYSGSGWDRGHMCPSADRTVSDATNQLVFLMSNIIPQNSSQNSGVWSSFEGACRTLASSGNEVLITCGPSGFDSTTIAGGYVYVPSNTWKIAVVVPLGSGDALSRINYSTRVIALEIPNNSSVVGIPWSHWATSAKQLQIDTGFSFFTALSSNLAWVLRSKVDGQTPAAPGSISFSPPSGMVGTSVIISGSDLDSTTNVIFNGTVASYAINSPDQITATVPAGAIPGPITVMTLGGTVTSSGTFTGLSGGPDLTLTKTHAADFKQGDIGDAYTIIVTNIGDTASSGTITVADVLPAGLTATAISGTGWTATLGTLTCTRSDALTPFAGYPPITVTVDVSASAPVSITNSASVSGGGDINPVNNTASDPTTINDSGPQLGVSPLSGLASSGYIGGPFSPASQVYVLTNSGDASLNWTANKTADWLTLSATSGILAPGAGANVTVSINTNANSLAPGSYSDTVGFANTTDGTGNTTREVNLNVSSVWPVLQTDGATLVSEGCTATNGAVDPDETVTISFSIRNVGTGPTANLVATLLATNGVTVPSGPQTYGALAASAAASQTFMFTASGVCGGAVQPTLQLQDGAENLGTITYPISLGHLSAMLAQSFDGVAVPSLPSGWTIAASGAASNWVTSTASADTTPNAAFSAGSAGVGVNELDSPGFAAGGSAPAQLTFRQKYSLAASATNSALGYDGGVLEISIDGGAFQDIVSAGGAFASGGYNTTLSSGYSNPLATRQAWSGNSGGFVTTSVNLPAVTAGQNVQLRWRCATGNPPPPEVVSSGTLAFWNFDSGTLSAATCLVPNYTNPSITVSSSGSFTPLNGAAFYTGTAGGFLTNGPFVQGNPTSGFAISGKSWSTSPGPVTTSMDCWAFALTVSNGMQARLSSFSFDDQRSGTGPVNFDVQLSQQPNFSSVIYDSGAKSTHSGFTSTPMNSLTLTNTGLTGTIYFRIYGYGAGGSAGTWRLDNLNVQGTITSGGATSDSRWYIDSISVSQRVCCVTAETTPVASFSGTPTVGTEPLTVSFNDTSTGTITDRFWDFGNSATTNVTTNVIAHTYAAGTYNVMLVVSGPDGVSTNTQPSYITALTSFQAWQILHFGSTTAPAAAANADPDGDGQNNLTEFLAGTDPTDSASFLHIISEAAQGPDILTTWATAGGHTNIVQVTSGDADGSYSTNDFVDILDSQTIVTGGGDAITNYLDAGAATNFPTRYYRVRLVP